MARLVGGSMGHFVGTLGNLVGSSRNGKPYLKTRPIRKKKRRNKKKTPNQNKFSMAHSWMQPLVDFVRVGFKEFKVSGEYNTAKGYVIKHAFEGTQPDLSINPALVKVSVGKLPLSADMAVSKSGANTIEFSWTYDGRIAGTNGADQVMMLAYDIKGQVASLNITGQFRRTGSDVLKVSKGKTYHLYMAFTSHDRATVSDSVYLGEIET
jgi:hypothetical protein